MQSARPRRRAFVDKPGPLGRGVTTCSSETMKNGAVNMAQGTDKG